MSLGDRSQLHEGDISATQNSVTGYHQTAEQDALQRRKAKEREKEISFGDQQLSQRIFPRQHSMSVFLSDSTRAPECDEFGQLSKHSSCRPKTVVKHSSIPTRPQRDRACCEEDVPKLTK